MTVHVITRRRPRRLAAPGNSRALASAISIIDIIIYPVYICMITEKSVAKLKRPISLDIDIDLDY